MLRVLRVLRVLVVVLVALLAAIAGIGLMIDQSHVASRSVVFQAAPEAIWKAVTDVDAYPTWRPDVTAVERLPAVPAGPAWVEVSGSGERLPLETVESEPPRRYVARIGPGQPFGGTWTYEIRPEGSGSRLTITERGEVYNPIFRFMARFVFGYSATMESYLDALGKRLS
ncbi:MAG: SRPBCC family protein [Vicinamibacterales bacterium]